MKEELILISQDTIATQSEIPPESDAITCIVYEVLTENPYRFTEPELHCEVHYERRGMHHLKIGSYSIKRSNLLKKYGWGIHKDSDGRLALVASDTDKYVRLSQTIKTSYGYRNKSNNDVSTGEPEHVAWSEEELRASVAAYLDMKTRSDNKERINKKDYYRQLTNQFGRTQKAFEYRMQNISYVFSLLERDWVPGLKPAKNVGKNTALIIEKFIAEIECRVVDERVEFEFDVQKHQSDPNQEKPAGDAEPKSSLSTSVVYKRSPEVKAWVLKRAKGCCELCDSEALFKKANGEPYLEVHHVKRLSLGGSDRVENCVALCANCHKRLHFSQDKEDQAQLLYKKVPELVVE
ncbi:DUF6157 family protein [Vibrio cyclitrophicus]|uniref:DUF6157 family protein n=1 Tax=Vibrio cyclitrophicus TaxID=47951 RepID=UPI001C94436A|nr:DUF6157 family protein [Vibrio cyclitrophicus]